MELAFKLIEDSLLHAWETSSKQDTLDVSAQEECSPFQLAIMDIHGVNHIKVIRQYSLHPMRRASSVTKQSHDGVPGSVSTL